MFRTFMVRTHATKVIKDNGDSTFTMETQVPNKALSFNFKLDEAVDTEMPTGNQKVKTRFEK